MFALYPNSLPAAEGDQKWEISLGDSIDSSPAIGYDGTLYFGSDGFKVYAVKSDGTLKWAVATGKKSTLFALHSRGRECSGGLR